MTLREKTSSQTSVDLPAKPKLCPGRAITGMSATLLPMQADGSADWDGFTALVARTFEAGLVPAVNMDTGYVNLIDNSDRRHVLEITQKLAAGRKYVAGAIVCDEQGDNFQADAYRQQIEQTAEFGGTPVVMQSYGLAFQENAAIVESYHHLSEWCDEFITHELGQKFAAFGKIYDLDVYQKMMQIENCIGSKHSSLSRQPEWDRLALRDKLRPEFMVLTGNDLAIDMVMYGCDYLLGLSTFAPESFALRDRLWRQEDPAFYELNDVLQYLGCFAFREPVSAYKHSAAQFLKLRGWIDHNATHPDSAERPESDIPVLREILQRLEELTGEIG
ncbi:MAG: dihydrodipicolinate synthase family protein [Planctomycetes bacterium]|nr:dihydrodipicolinate synthase family protein [Planctomycetota bacterium]